METNKAKPICTTQRFWLPAFAILMIAAAPTLHAEAGNPLNDTFNVSLGGFLLDTDTTIRADGELGTGTEVDLGRDVGLQDSDRFRLDAYWRMTPRQKLRLMYFDTSANGRRVIDEEIEFNGETFPIDIEVAARVKTQVIALSYEFDFLQSDTYELGGTFGLHTLKFETGLSAEGSGAQADI